MHRVGGLEKEEGTGNVSYDPENHERMVHIRADKIAGIARDIPPAEHDSQDGAETVVLSWGSTWGVAESAVTRLRNRGKKIGRVHVRHLNPFPAELGDTLRSYKRVIVPEMNLGQLSRLVRAEYLVDARSVTKVQGVPFRAAELEEKILEMIDQ